MMGYYLAEYCHWRVALNLLQQPKGAMSLFQQGLFEGLWRMGVLARHSSYPAPTWVGVDHAQLSRRLAEWARAAKRTLPEPNTLAAAVFDPRCVTRNLAPSAALRFLDSL